MKLLILMLVLVSCGKKSQLGSESYKSLSIFSDQDGDGISDAEEVKLGRNHLVANIDTNNVIKNDTLILLDAHLNEFEVKVTPQRLLRSELLRSVTGLHKEKISDINVLTIDFNSSKEFWKAYHREVPLDRYYFKTEKNIHYALPAKFNETRSLKVNTFSDHGILQGVKESTYRLIISTPQQEVIYYLHPSLSIVSFLQHHHSAHFSQNDLIKLDGLESGQEPDAKKWDFFTDSFSTIHNPKPGKTYAFVYADLMEYQKAAFLNGPKQLNASFESPFHQTLEKTIFLPSFHKRETSTIESRQLLEFGEIRTYCSIYESIDRGFTPFTASAEQIKGWLNSSLLEHVSVLWSYSSSKGTTLRFRANTRVLKEATLLNQTVQSASVGIGVFQSNCNFSRPNLIPHPLYTGHKDFYLAD